MSLTLYDRTTMEVNDEGTELQRKVYFALEPILSDYVKRGYPTHEITQVVQEEMHNWRHREIFDRHLNKTLENVLNQEKEAA